jgi:hypothetical protein
MALQCRLASMRLGDSVDVVCVEAIPASASHSIWAVNCTVVSPPLVVIFVGDKYKVLSLGLPSSRVISYTFPTETLCRFKPSITLISTARLGRVDLTLAA